MRLAVLISGSGSNLQAILNACREGRLEAEVVAVFSNRPSAYGLVRAAGAGVPALVLGLGDFPSRAAYDRALAEQVANWKPDLVVLAGWMHILGPDFLDRFPGRVINLHPALPGAFPGKDAIAQAYRAFQEGRLAQTGCMVHYAVAEVDAGPIVCQTTVSIGENDTLADLEQAMHEAEHRLLVEAIGTLVRGYKRSAAK